MNKTKNASKMKKKILVALVAFMMIFAFIIFSSEVSSRKMSIAELMTYPERVPVHWIPKAKAPPAKMTAIEAYEAYAKDKDTPTVPPAAAGDATAWYNAGQDFFAGLGTYTNSPFTDGMGFWSELLIPDFTEDMQDWVNEDLCDGFTSFLAGSECMTSQWCEWWHDELEKLYKSEDTAFAYDPATGQLIPFAHIESAKGPVIDNGTDTFRIYTLTYSINDIEDEKDTIYAITFHDGDYKVSPVASATVADGSTVGAVGSGVVVFQHTRDFTSVSMTWSPAIYMREMDDLDTSINYVDAFVVAEGTSPAATSEGDTSPGTGTGFRNNFGE